MPRPLLKRATDVWLLRSGVGRVKTRPTCEGRNELRPALDRYLNTLFLKEREYEDQLSNLMLTQCRPQLNPIMLTQQLSNPVHKHTNLAR